MRVSLTPCAQASSYSPEARTCSTRSIRTFSPTAPKGADCSRGSGWRIGDHRREFALGGDFTIEHRPAGELADARPLLQELYFEPKQDSGLDGLAEFHSVDRHEVDQLA